MIERGIHAADYVIIAIILVVTVAIGFFFAFTGGKQKTTSEYFVGNRQLHVIPVSLSLSATAYSSVLMVGFPAEVYTGGGVLWLYAVGILLGAIMVSLIFIPVFHPLKLTSMNHIARGGVTLYAQSTTIAAMTGYDEWKTILIASFLTIVYTTIGGIKAVVWTDVFQSLIMLTSLIVITIKAVEGVGDISRVWEICGDWERINFNNFDPDPRVTYTFWSVVIGIGFLNIHRYGPTQVAVQRYASMPKLKDAILCIFGLVPMAGLWLSLASLSGLATFAFYADKRCDPVRSKAIPTPNQLLPYFVMDTLNTPGIPGIFLAGIIAASLSSVSSILNSSAANLWGDVIQQFWPKLPERTNVLVTKALVVVFGILSMILAIFINEIGGTIVRFIIGFVSALAAPTTSMFFLGLVFTFVNWKGAAVGGILGSVFSLWMTIGPYTVDLHSAFLPTPIDGCGTNRNESLTSTTYFPTNSSVQSRAKDGPLYDFYSVSYLWISLYALLFPMVIGIVVSLLTGCMKGKEVDPRLLHPLVRKILGKKVPSDDTSVSKDDQVMDQVLKSTKL